MPWVYLAAAILLEVAGTVCMKLSDTFTKPGPSIMLFVFYGASFAFVTLAVGKIDIATAYAIWSGAGTALIALVGFLYFKEPMGMLKVASLILIILGVVGLRLAGEST